jgi:hypothetical protein
MAADSTVTVVKAIHVLSYGITDDHDDGDDHHHHHHNHKN